MPLSRVAPVSFVLSAPLPREAFGYVVEEGYEGAITVREEEPWALHVGPGGISLFVSPHLFTVFESRELDFDDTGRCAIPGLRPGRYVIVGHPDYRFVPASFDLGARRDVPVALGWERR